MIYPPHQRGRNAIPLVITAVVGIVAILCGYGILRFASTGNGAGGADVHRTGCTPVLIASSSGKAALLQKVANRYNSGNRTYGDRKCADVTVKPTASGAAVQALASGWDAKEMGFPQPQVWAPASSSWISVLHQQAGTNDKAVKLADAKPQSIVQTPLVLAMPKPMAEALGWPNRPIGWSDILDLTQNPAGWGALGHPEWGSFKLGKTNPHLSTSGLNATIGAYFAATGRSAAAAGPNPTGPSPTGQALTEQDLADPKVVAFGQGLESSVVHYGDTTLTFLANLLDADTHGAGLSYVSAVAVEEKSVWDYNTGNPSGDPATAGKGRRPQVPLVAVYPREGTLLADNPYVELAGLTDDQRAGAEDFLSYLHEAAQQQTFTDAGFRTYDGKAGTAVSTVNGMLPDAKYTVLNAPPAAVAGKALSAWDSQRKRARVLIVLDVSGPMGELTDSGQSRLELAKAAAKHAIAQFAPDDEVGLWTFAAPLAGGDLPYRENVPIGLVAQNAKALDQSIDQLTAGGGTALYATIRAAQKYLVATSDPERINAVVVLSAGPNQYAPDDNLNSLLKDLDTSKLANPVPVFTVAYGDHADLDTLKQISGASRAAAYDARDPATITNVLSKVISNF